MSHKSRRRHQTRAPEQPPLRLPLADSASHGPQERPGGPPPQTEEPHEQPHGRKAHDQPWLPTSGLVGRSRRSARRQ